MTKEPNWTRLLQEWDRQQEEYITNRERTFQSILDVLAAKNSGGKFVALDLGCGPGSLSKRVVERFPKARVVAVDYDPVVLQIGKEALNRFRRITWLEADLGGTELGRQLASYPRFDAAISTTALHWLYPPQLRSLYMNLGKKIRRGGIFVNGDGMPWERRALRTLSEKIKRLHSHDHHHKHGWSKWWQELQNDRYFDELFRIRKTRFPHIHSKAKSLPLEFHKRTLLEAGFRNVDVMWSNLEYRILVAIK